MATTMQYLVVLMDRVLVISNRKLPPMMIDLSWRNKLEKDMNTFLV